MWSLFVTTSSPWIARKLGERYRLGDVTMTTCPRNPSLVSLSTSTATFANTLVAKVPHQTNSLRVNFAYQSPIIVECVCKVVSLSRHHLRRRLRCGTLIGCQVAVIRAVNDLLPRSMSVQTGNMHDNVILT